MQEFRLKRSIYILDQLLKLAGCKLCGEATFWWRMAMLVNGQVESGKGQAEEWSFCRDF
jgi:ribosome-associated protein YbcJ (S4-like RNA binding protein)